MPHLSLHGQPFDFEATLLGGQAFRWRRDGERFEGVVNGGIVRLSPAPERDAIEYETSLVGGDVEERISHYLALDVDLERVHAAIRRAPQMRELVDRYRGLRILRQDPWETTVSYLCSMINNVPRITRNVEAMCDAYGRPLRLGGRERHAFPTPAALSEAGEGELRSLKLGFRAKYIASVAAEVASGRFDLEHLRGVGYQEALNTLTGLAGVGEKVGDCILLFAFDEARAFPYDTNVRQALIRLFPDDFDGVSQSRKTSHGEARRARAEAQRIFGEYAGYANQYLFHWQRETR